MAEDPDYLLAELADGYCERLRAGEHVNIEDYCTEHPQLADDIRDLFPTMAQLEITKMQDELEQIGEFVVKSEIGRGGMGIVYEAEQLSLGRRVALKIIRSEAINESSQRRFQREACLIGQLEHPHIVPIYAYGVEDEQQYFAMRYIRGPSLQDIIDEGTQTPEDSIVIIAQQLASALAYAHSQGIRHRDIKPGNIMLDAGPHAWLSDFGLAIDTHGSITGSLAGTIRYMAPECLAGDDDERSDIYALGISLIELYTFTPVFPQKNSDELLDAVQTGLSSLPPGIPENMQKILSKACHVHPHKRFTTAQAFEEALATVKMSSFVTVQNNLKKTLLFAALLLLFFAGLLFFGLDYYRPQPPQHLPPRPAIIQEEPQFPPPHPIHLPLPLETHTTESEEDWLPPKREHLGPPPNHLLDHPPKRARYDGERPRRGPPPGKGPRFHDRPEPQ